MIPALLVVAAVAVVLWPSPKPPSRPIGPADLHPPEPPRPTHPTYQSAMAALALVRRRILAVEGDVPQDAGNAIEVITHALVAGSDHE